MTRPIDVVRGALETRTSVAPRGRDHDFMAQCPAHDDGRPSLHVTEGDDDRVLFRCFADCSTQEIVAALGLDWADVFPARPETRPMPTNPGRTVEFYEYTDEAGEPLFRVERREPKAFRQQRRENGAWEWGLGETRRVLYRLPQVREAIEAKRYIFVTEGEKDAHAIEAAGEVATTMPGGAGKWRDEYTESLVGARVVIVADDDEPGRKHAADVWRRLQGQAAKVGARLPAEGHKDIASHLADGLTLRDLRKLPEVELAAAPLPASSNGDGPQMFTARVFAARPSLGRRLQVLGPLFQRGMRTTIGAQTGEGKSTLGLQAIRCLVRGEPFLEESWRPVGGGGRALVVDLEQGEETIKNRLREAGLDDSDAVDVLWEPAGLALDTDVSHQQLLYDTLRRGRYDFVLLDPLYQMHRGDSNNERIAADMMRVVDAWAREFNVALVIPMHARKPHPQAGRNFTLNDIAGSTGWNRNAEFVLGLQLMSAGASRLWFFKDRIGSGPEIRKHWWLKFSRQGGFERSFLEDRQQVRRALAELLDRDEGATREELEKAGGDDVSIKAALKKAHDRGDGRYRARPWAEQTALSTDGDMA